MANMTFKASLLPNSQTFGYSLGSETNKWKIYGDQHQEFDYLEASSEYTIPSYIIKLINDGYRSGWFGCMNESGKGCPTSTGDLWYNIHWERTKIGNRIYLEANPYGVNKLYKGSCWANNETSMPVWEEILSKTGADDEYVNVIGDTMTGTLEFNKAADIALLKNTYSGTSYNLIRNHNNGNISLSASNGGLYIGYENTNLINWKNNAMLLNSSNNLGLGTTSPAYKLDVVGSGRFSNRVYVTNWVQFSDNSGLYMPNSGSGTHFYPANSPTYGSFSMQGMKGGYCGITMGPDNNYMTVMSSGVHNGLYNTSKGRWSHYYNRDSDQVGIYSSNVASGFNITLNGSTYNTSTLRSAGEIQTTSANSMRLVCGNYGVFQRNDGSNWWFMVTDSGSQYGSYNSLRPFRINIASGLVYMENKTVIGCTASSWIDGQKNNNAAVNIVNATNTGSYWPWMRQANTSSGKYFSFGTLNTSFYWIGSASSKTNNSYDYGMQFNIANGYLQGCSRVYGAVWNDYAEMREVPEAQKTKWVDEDAHNPNPLAGRCVREVGDDTMVLSTARLQRGCKIISDTFGFNIGETENAKTPIAVSGRALVYLAESRETARSHIGWPVCSGPDGTVSIMTEEEEEKYPSRIVGTISSVPDYEEWGTGKVKVNGRIWIYVR